MGTSQSFFVGNPWCFLVATWFHGDESLWPRRRANDVFDYPIGQQKDVANHPCPKPLKMWIDLLEHYSEQGDLIYEAFSGSGTTLIACEMTGRHCRALEISPAYIAVSLERYMLATGTQPYLIAEEWHAL